MYITASEETGEVETLQALSNGVSIFLKTYKNRYSVSGVDFDLYIGREFDSAKYLGTWTSRQFVTDAAVTIALAQRLAEDAE